MDLQKTYLLRMTHYSNIGFILRNGLHCCNGGVQAPNYISIGSRTLINRRGAWPVTVPPGGVLNDYIPFYFHYKMPMLYKIWKSEVPDYSGNQEEIIYIGTTVAKIMELNLSYVFTDRHAYVAYRQFYNQHEDFNKLNWNIIKDDTWFKEYSQQRKELKQAEFLVHRHLPVEGIMGIIANNDKIVTFVKDEAEKAGVSLPIIAKPDYYY